MTEAFNNRLTIVSCIVMILLKKKMASIIRKDANKLMEEFV